MRNDVRHICNKCGHRVSRRDDAIHKDYNCPVCDGGRLVRVQPMKDLKNARAREEIDRIYKTMESVTRDARSGRN